MVSNLIQSDYIGKQQNSFLMPFDEPCGLDAIFAGFKIGVMQLKMYSIPIIYETTSHLPSN